MNHTPRPFSLAPRLAAALTSALLFAGAFAAPAAAAPVVAQPVAEPAAKAPPAAPFTAGRYIVTLSEAPVATYDGGVKSFDATRAPEGTELNPRSRRAKSYGKHLADQQSAVAGDVGATIGSSFTVALNGFTASLTAEQASKLYADPRVASVVPNQLLHTQGAVTSTDFLHLSGPNGVWAATGGIQDAGKGVVVGVIDTGIAPENPSFAGAALGTTPGSEPWRDGDTIRFDKADGGTFAGSCVTGQQFVAADCTTKIIGARYFIDDESKGALYDPAHGEYLSPRDGAGHGSHTASTAAGNNGVAANIGGAPLGMISGVAPAAKLAAYKVCWHFTSGDGCYSGDIINAIESAVLDGVDVLNYSIGGGGAESTVTPTDQAFFGAAAAGIFVAASAGNDGPDASTADNANPWITTVAAATIPARDTTVTLGNGQSFLGGSITLPTSGTLSGPLVSALKNNVTGTRPTALCSPGSLDPVKVHGKIVVCERGQVDRVAKSAEVLRAGGIGMILVNPVDNSIDLDVHSVPTVHVNYGAYDALVAYADTVGATATFIDGNPTKLATVPAPQIAGFSSRGPILADGGDILKPDITAPGVAILADGPNSDTGTPTFEFLSGTSMSSPHIAGLAALYLSERPNASPAEIKSAMMTTAYPTLDSDGNDTSDPFAQGAGHVDPARFFNPGMLFLNDVDDWKAYVQATGVFNFGVAPIDPSELNLASVSVGALAGNQTVTRTVTSTAAGDFTAQPVSMAGVDVTVTPSSLHFDGPGETKTFTIAFARTTAPLDTFATGYLRWVDGTTVVTSPLAVRPVPLGAPAEVSGTGATGTADVTVQPGISGTLTATGTGLARGVSLAGDATQDGQLTSYVVTVPEGATFARFALDATDDAVDLDLHTYRLNDFNFPVNSGESTSGLADERVDIDAPEAGQYVIEVDDVAGHSGYTLTSYVLDPSSAAGAFTVTPSSQNVSLNTDATVSASWTGLAAGGSYVGRVAMTATDADSGTEASSSTIVSVTTSGAAPVQVPTDPKLESTVEYVKAGDRIGFVGSGLGAVQGYRLMIDSNAQPLAEGSVSDGGTLGRYVTIPEGTPLGKHTITAVFDDATSVSADITVSSIGFRKLYTQTSSDFDGSPLVTLIGVFGGAGKIRFAIETTDGTTVMTEDKQVESNPWVGDAESVGTRTIRIEPGDYVGKLWQVLDDGSRVQEMRMPFAVTAGTPSTLELGQSATDANSVDFTLQNNADHEYRTQLRYKTCAGPIVASTYRTLLGTNVDTLNLAGISHVDFMVSGRVIGSYTNPSVDRCAGTPTFAQEMWVTFEKATGKHAKASAPITATMRFRYPANVYGMELTAGYGPDLKVDKFFEDRFPVDVVQTPGPVVERTFSVDEGKQFWVNSDFEIQTPTKSISARREVQSEPVTLAMLAPVVGPGDHGNPGNPGPGNPGPGNPGPGAGNPAPGTGAHNGGSHPAAAGLASTGVSITGSIVIAALLLGAGFVLVRMRRRTRRAQ